MAGAPRTGSQMPLGELGCSGSVAQALHPPWTCRVGEHPQASRADTEQAKAKHCTTGSQKAPHSMGKSQEDRVGQCCPEQVFLTLCNSISHIQSVMHIFKTRISSPIIPNGHGLLLWCYKPSYPFFSLTVSTASMRSRLLHGTAQLHPVAQRPRGQGQVDRPEATPRAASAVTGR